MVYMSEQLSPVSHEQIMKLLLAFGMHLKEEHDKEIKDIENRHKAEIEKLKDEIVSLKEQICTDEVCGEYEFDESEDEEEEEYEREYYELEPEIEREESDILEGIKCVDCGRVLPAHTKMEHLDFSHPIHECPHRVF